MKLASFFVDHELEMKSRRYISSYMLKKYTLAPAQLPYLMKFKKKSILPCLKVIFRNYAQ